MLPQENLNEKVRVFKAEHWVADDNSTLNN